MIESKLTKQITDHKQQVERLAWSLKFNRLMRKIPVLQTMQYLREAGLKAITEGKKEKERKREKNNFLKIGQCL